MTERSHETTINAKITDHFAALYTMTLYTESLYTRLWVESVMFQLHQTWNEN